MPTTGPQLWRGDYPGKDRYSGISPQQAFRYSEGTILAKIATQRHERDHTRRSALPSGCQHTKRARCVRLLSKHINLDRRSIAKRERRSASKPTKLNYVVQKQSSIALITRVDNCTVAPGKKYVIEENKETNQKCL